MVRNFKHIYSKASSLPLLYHSVSSSVIPFNTTRLLFTTSLTLVSTKFNNIINHDIINKTISLSRQNINTTHKKPRMFCLTFGVLVHLFIIIYIKSFGGLFFRCVSYLNLGQFGFHFSDIPKRVQTI